MFNYLRQPMHAQKKAYFFALAAIAFWSTIGSAFKITLRYLDPVWLLLISSFVACIVLFAILMMQGKLALLRHITLNQVIMSAFLGLLNPFLYYLVLLTAYDILPAQVAGTLNYIWPLMLVLLSIPMLKQKISWMSIVAILISFTGIMVISYNAEGVSAPRKAAEMLPDWGYPVGVLLAVGSAVLWAFYWIFNLKDQREAVGKLFLNFCFGFIYTLMLAIFTGNIAIPQWQGIVGGVYIGLFEMGITFVLWLNALKFSVTTAKVSNLIYISPFISLIIIHFFVGETILLTTIAGLALIVSGILMQQYLKR